MKAWFEQAFYGRGERGYGVLAASPGGRRFAAKVEALCGGVGTAGGDYGGEPFLLSAPDGECVVMACGRRGGADAAGRATLFFHVLVAPRATLDAAGADAFSLFAQGAFAERMPEGETGAAEIDVRPGNGGGSGGGAAVALPVVVRSKRPEPEAVRALAGGRANELSWATCAFQFMEGFDIQVVPPGAVLPRGADERDAAGRLVRGGGAAPRGEAKMGGGAAAGAGSGGGDWRGDADCGAGKPVPGPWKLSLAANAVLAILCAWLWLTRQPAAEEGGGGGGPAERAAIERSAVERYRVELSRSFPREARIADFGAAVTNLPNYEAIESDPKHRAAREFVGRAKTYVDFLNGILETPQTKETSP